MSAIIAIKNGDRVVIGGDTAGTQGDRLLLDVTKKVWRVNDDWAFGVVGTLAFLNYMKHRVNVPDSWGVIATEWLPKLKTNMAKEGIWDKDEGCYTKEYQESHFILAHKGDIYEFNGLLSFCKQDFCAIGVGDEFTLGMYRLYKYREMVDLNIFRDDKQFVEYCLGEIALNFNSVRKPFTILEV